MTALLVEDDIILRQTIADFFDAAGVAFIEAGNADEALRLFDCQGPSIDVLVTDLDLGAGDNGITLALKARQRRPGLRVIFATGNWELLSGHPMSLGEHVFYKPFNPAALVAMVSRLSSASPAELGYAGAAMTDFRAAAA